MQKMLVLATCTLIFVFDSPLTQAGINDFKGGIRIPAGSCVTYSNTPKAEIISNSGGLAVYNMNGQLDVSCVCQVPARVGCADDRKRIHREIPDRLSTY